MKKLNSINLFKTVCPNCKKENPEKHINFAENANTEEREAAEREKMRCDFCGYDIYGHNKKQLGKPDKERF